MVGVCRSGCVGRLFSRNRVVSCRSGLVVLEKYEAYIEACSNQAVLNLSGNLEVQVQIAAVRVRVHVGPPTPLICCQRAAQMSRVPRLFSDLPYARGRLVAKMSFGQRRCRKSPLLEGLYG